MGSVKWVLFIVVCAAVAAQEAGAWFASCRNVRYKRCYGVSKSCPSACPERCCVNCRRCKAICRCTSYVTSASNLSAACDKPGAVCHDPRFVGGDGKMFYFHGKIDRDYCLLSHRHLHINAHFMGKHQDLIEPKRELTWVKSIGMLFGSHEIYLGTKKVGRWESGVDQMVFVSDGESVILPPHKGGHWEDRVKQLKITRILNVNAVIIQVTDMFNLTAWIVPVTIEETYRVHGFEITEEDCFAHLHLSFNFFGLGSHEVTGVLGQTYSSGFKSTVEVGGVLQGEWEDMFAVSHLFATDCKVARFDK